MTLQELLEELRESILRDVSSAVSADEADLLWPDRTLVRYINEAHQRFCERSLILEDATTPEVCEIALQSGVQSYPLHPSIIQVTSATYKDLALKRSTVAMEHGLPDEVAHVVPHRLASYRGVTAFVPDYNVGTFRVMGTPTDDEDGGVVRLRVMRLPLEDLTLDNPEAEPEIPKQYHLDMIEWAAFRALRNHDADAENMAKASAHSTRFERAIEEARRTHRARTFTGIQFAPSWRW